MGAQAPFICCGGYRSWQRDSRGRPTFIQMVRIYVGLFPVVAQLVSGRTDAREVLVQAPSRSVEERRCGSGEGPQQVGVASDGALV